MITTSLPKKLKVLVCAYACLGESGVKVKGGEAVLGWNIVKQLARFHQVFVLTHSENRSVIEKSLKKEPISNIKFYYLDLPFLNFLQRFSGGVQFYAYFWQIKAYFFAKKLHQKIHFDLFHHLTYANDWMASFIGALLPIPYIRGPGGGAQRTPSAFLHIYSLCERLEERLRSIGQWFFRHDPFFILGQDRAKAILICNNEILKIIPKKWQNKTYLFPVNGVSEEDLVSVSNLKKSNDKFRVLSAGKFLYWKAFNLAIRAFKAFLKVCPNSELILVGDGPQFPHLKTLVETLGIQRQVKFKGWLQRKELLKEMSLCDVFLYPSLREGGGAVVVEAMAVGKPIICLDKGGPGMHVTEDCGIKITPKSPEQVVQEMAKALERLYKNKDLSERMGRAARERAEKFYHWDRLGERLFKIYQEVLKI
jgi:glycosyltransferase involved in cell wall biosynthesis